MRPFVTRFRWTLGLVSGVALAISGAAGESSHLLPLTTTGLPSVGFDPPTQAVRVTVVNPRADPTWAVVHFYTAAGRPLKHAPLSIGPRETAFLDLTVADLCGTTDRTQVWAAVKSRDASLCSGVEVYDTHTGETTFRFGRPHDVSAGSAGVIFPSVGMAADQAVRATVVNASAVVSRPVVVFFDAVGQTLKRVELALQPRQIGWVDLSQCELASVVGRAQIRVEVSADQSGQITGCEVYTIATHPAIPECSETLGPRVRRTFQFASQSPRRRQ